MRPIIQYESSLTVRALRAIHPLWSLMARVLPKAFGPPTDHVPHPSSMVRSPNWIWRLILPRFFKRISVDAGEVARLAKTSKDATVVYITKYAGQLEYSYFNHLFQDRALPLAQYNNEVGMRRWLKPRDFMRSMRAQEGEIGRQGRVIDPLYDGFLPQMIAAGQSAFIRIPPADLLDEELILTGPLRSLVAVIEAQRASRRPVAIVPVDFLWSRRPPKAKRGMRDIIFGEQHSPGVIRKFFLFWRNYRRRAHASIGEPILIDSFLAQNQSASDEELAKRLRGMLLEALKAQRMAVTGPPMRPRSWFIQEVLTDEGLDRRVCEIAAERGKRADDVRELALRYAREIVADLDYSYVEILERILGKAFSRIFKSLDVDEEGLKLAKDAYAKGPVVFVPNHKSHVDYLVLSYIFYHKGMIVPHIAAGTNLSFWPLGRIFRRCGAYFIRRAFRDNPLYKAVLQTYLKLLMREGVPQEFFIEGGRSRTGKLKRPKLGMVGMLKQAARAAGVKNASFVPVCITYDRVIEQRSYVKEMEGSGKKDERPSDLFGLMKFLKKRDAGYGSIHVRFGEPIPLMEGQSKPEEIARDAERICHEINRKVVVTPAAVAATAILPVSRQGIAIAQFRRNARAVLDCLAAKGAEVPAPLLGSPDGLLQDALATLANLKLVAPKLDAIEPFIACDERRRVPLGFFRNGIVHLLVTLGVLSKYILWHARKEQAPTAADLATDLCSAKRLLHHEFRFATSRRTDEHVSSAVTILKERGAIDETGDGRLMPRNSGLWILDLLSAQIRPAVETLWVAMRYADERMNGSMDKRSLVDAMLAAGQDMYQLGKVRFRESVTKEGFMSAIGALVNFGVLIREPQQEGTKRRESFAPAKASEATENLKEELEKLL